jgi:phage repressor protein C with HTH and peptisase S24 domain
MDVDKALILNQIKKYLKFKNDKDFAEFLGIKQNTLSTWKSRNTIDYEKIIEKCDFVDANWLLKGDGSMLSSDRGMQAFKLRTDNDLQQQLIPIYNLEATAGLVELFRGSEEMEVLDTMSIPNLPRCDGAVYVAGDSMYPLLKNGDIVAYRKVEDIQNDIFWGEMYLLSIDVGEEEFVTVKYIQKSEKGIEYIKLVSENKHHQDKDVQLKKIRALALIKATIRLNTMN